VWSNYGASINATFTVIIYNR